MFNNKIGLLSLVASSCLLESAYCDLVITVTGVVGSGETTWTFSGSYVTTVGALADEITVVPSNSGTNSNRILTGLNLFSHGLGLGNPSVEIALEESFNDASVALTGTATIIGSQSGNHILNGLYIDSDPGEGDDDFGWFSNGSFIAGETLVFSGSGIMQRDITEFGDPALIGGRSFVFSSTTEVTPLSVTFSAITGEGTPINALIESAHNITFETVLGRSYILESTESLGDDWIDTGRFVIGTGREMNFYVDAILPKEFYRVLEVE